MKKLTAAATAALVCLSVGVALPASTTAAVSRAAAASGANPWQTPGYVPAKGDWRPYLLAPATRDVAAVSVVAAVAKDGTITDAPKILSGRGEGATVSYDGSDTTKAPRITLDFGKEVTGALALTVTSTSNTPPKLRAAFSESMLFMSADGSTGMYGDMANSTNTALAALGDADPYKLPHDYESHPITLTPHPAGTPATTVVDTAIRGGFRYVALFLSSAGSVSINAVSTHFSAAPKQADLRAYKGWFLSSDNVLNKLWYSGAYTIQTDTIDPKQGGCVPQPPMGSDNPSCLVSEGDSVLVDGAKRDRLPWGFVNFEESVAYLSTQDYTSPLNNIKTRLDLQRENGFIPGTWPGSVNTSTVMLGPFLEIHILTVRSALDYVLYSGDMQFVSNYYQRIKKAEEYTLTYIDSSGLVNDNSFGCLHDIGYAECGHTMTANAMTYQSLISAAQFADLAGDPAQAQAWRTKATQLAALVNAKLYDAARGAYVQSVESNGVISQEGTSLAIYWGLAPAGNAQRALAYLKATGWNEYGSAIWDRPGGNMKSGGDATKPWVRYDEPYPTYYELVSRIEQHNDADAATLLRRYWGHMLDDDPRYPGSPPLTMWERATIQGLPTLITNFPAPLVSQAHDWGAGPTAALTNKVLGVTPTKPGFKEFDVRPHPLDLAWAQGAVPTPAGPISVSYDAGSASPGAFTMDVTVPSGTTATVAVPLLGGRRAIQVDGVRSTPSSGDDYYATFTGVTAGTHHYSYVGLAANDRVCPLQYTPAWPAGTTATATSTAEPRALEPSDVTTFGATAAIDSNPASSWEAGDKNAASITVTPPTPVTTPALRLWFGPEGAPGQVHVSVQTGGVWRDVLTREQNSDALVNVPFASPLAVQAVRVALDGAHKDALGAERVRLFEIQPTTDSRSPLALDTVSELACTSAGTPSVLAPGLIGTTGDIPIHFHYTPSDAKGNPPNLVRVMDRTPSAGSFPPFGQHFDQTGNPGPSDSDHYQWASPPVTSLGLPEGVDIDNYQFHVWVLTSWPGVQPSDVASLHVDLYRLGSDGKRELIKGGSASIPASTLNQETLVAGTVPVTTHLAPGDRLFADAYITGVRSSILYFSYDDRTFDSGMTLHQAEQRQRSVGRVQAD